MGVTRAGQANSTQRIPKPKALEAKELAGIYVGKLAVEGPYMAAEFQVSADGKYSVRVANIDSGPSPSISGKWQLKNGRFVGSHNAPGMGKVTIDMDLKDTTLPQLKKAGRPATLTIGGQSLPFQVVKTDKNFFDG